jgi:uncharacterized protein YutE (UPF0331/DUF86 family)
VVDQARVLRLLRAITDDLSVLRHEADADDERRADPIWLRGIKYTFVTAIEACVDVAQHICATQTQCYQTLNVACLCGQKTIL